jgi:hypothetical protein
MRGSIAPPVRRRLRAQRRLGTTSTAAAPAPSMRPDAPLALFTRTFDVFEIVARRDARALPSGAL